MDCRDVRRALPALLDGDLPPARAEAVREHLAGCPRCRRAYEAYRQDQQVLTQFLRTAPWLPVAAEVREQVRGRRGFWHALATGGNRLAAAGALVALLALVAASGFVLHTMVQRGGSPQPALGNTPTVAAAAGPCG
ncbi:MAG: zf-HC2 domain-containing protein, partial [Thermomicrobiaceae bacterium]|nr:zf-HC2 domain-containing protein [Thermomicrobiaceae bacterium]